MSEETDTETRYKNVISQTIEVETNENCHLIEKCGDGFLDCRLANAFCKHEPGGSNPCPLDQNGVVVKVVIYKKVS